MNYMYNAKTGKLHIEGYCCHARGQNSEYLRFNTESEALAYDGRAVGLCKICEKEREKRNNKKEVYINE